MDLPLGWIDPDHRTEEQQAVHEDIVAAMPAFSLVGERPPVGTKILLADTWKSAAVVQSLGQAFTGWHQFTGSCVGVGGGNAGQTSLLVDAIIERQPEKIILFFWPYNYGRSRLLAGMRGRGEGSFGSTFFKSLSTDGGCEWNRNLGLPTYIAGSMYDIGKSVEYEWSDGTRAPQGLRDEAKGHLFHGSPLSSGTQVRDAIVNGYPCTRASMLFCNPGSAKVRNGALIGSYNGRGGHQESWLGYWNHPQEGELIWEQNQWGANVYGTDPGGGPAGGCWLRIDDVDRMCNSNGAEVYAVSEYEGYPARPQVFDWATRSLWS